MSEQTEPFSVAKNQKSAMQSGITGVISITTVVAVIGLLRGLGVELGSPENDAVLAGEIVAAVGGVYAVAHIVGTIWNWFHNRDRPKGV